ncbi:alpha/beta hydrolase [Mucilaginibacter ginsenosidivorax]|uniref:Lysophospholipase n=1 Tax=Mucilaginibacter ginsenosidivorax TaxID=862126 RepID=A0A5B8VYH0_9SPHI|nr:alpha/beta fold hydrolase [Mucilaginibacter ginsenosidivorax]QEC76393.1 lysophospholipase [Mucilaginibacter ginsenosidivorax]
MNIILKVTLWLIGIFMGIYLAICCFFYFSQDNLIFQGTGYPAGYQYNFSSAYKEYNIKTADGNTLNGVLFITPKSKGLVFYLHGNGGTIDSWHTVAGNYNNVGYDVFMPDYPGYGKSTGHIKSQQQLLDAVKMAYQHAKTLYPENQIVILGYSIGTGPAAWLASQNHPQKLILLAPYYSLADEAKTLYPFLPSFILKYPLQTYEYLQHTSSPIVIFHGDADELINLSSSRRLQKHFKPGDKLIILKGQHHNGLDDNTDYQAWLKKML